MGASSRTNSTIGFGSIKHRIYKARIFTAVDAEMRAINRIVFFCHFFFGFRMMSTFFGTFIDATGLFDTLCGFAANY
jgi:hypothetical protein